MERSPEKRIKWKLNILDIVIICVALIAAMLLLKLMGVGGTFGSSASRQTVIYTIEFEGMHGDTSELVMQGDELVDKIEKRILGKIVSVNVIPYMIPETDRINGGRFMQEVPERKSVIVTVEAEALVDEKNITVDGFDVRAGAHVSANGPHYSANGYVTYIERENLE